MKFRMAGLWPQGSFPRGSGKFQGIRKGDPGGPGRGSRALEFFWDSLISTMKARTKIVLRS